MSVFESFRKVTVKTVKVGSNECKNLTNIFNGSENEKFSLETIYILREVL